jgi:HAD superfamily hydrolase (TIGR01509 family)
VTVPIDAVLLDLYETLVWPDWAVIQARRDALATRAGVAVVTMRDQWRLTHDERMRGSFGGLDGDLSAMLTACGITPTPALVQTLARLEEANWAQGVQLYEDTLPRLAELRQRGLRLAIVSNASHEAGGVVGALGLDRAVDTVVLSCDVGALKPDPSLFRVALERLNVAPRRAPLVDDVTANLDAAAELGLRTLRIARGGDPIPNPSTEPTRAAHPVISQLDQVWPYLNGGTAHVPLEPATSPCVDLAGGN